MNIAHPGILDRRRKLALGEAGPARDRPIAHVNQRRYTCPRKGGENVRQQRLLVADRIQRAAGHAAR
jgi:hypothetical protein